MNAFTHDNDYTLEKFTTNNALPSLPEVAVRLLQIADVDQTDYQQIAQIIRTDPVISGKILKVTNSALFGFRKKIESIEEALPKLGLNMIRTIILGFHLAEIKKDRPELSQILRRHWRSSLTQAVVAELIAEKLKLKNPEIYFLAALLQDIGILAMISAAHQEYAENILNRVDFPEVVSAEKSYFGFSHVEVTMAILRTWGIEDSFDNGLKHHHDRITPAIQTSHQHIIPILQAASRGAQMMLSDRSSGLPLQQAVQQWAGFVNSHFRLNAQQCEAIIDEISARVNQYCAMFDFDIGDGVCPDQVVKQAKDRLQRIAFELIEKSIMDQTDRSEVLYKDSLSGLRNRRFLDEKLPDLVAENIRRKRSIGLIFIDVDKFKSINDTLGHAAGDQAIEVVANWITQSIRSHDIAIRLGGDEFVIIIQEVSVDALSVIVNRITAGTPSLVVEGEDPWPIKLSLGCIHVLPEKAGTIDSNRLLELADQLMYQAKRRGGGNFVMGNW